MCDGQKTQVNIGWLKIHLSFHRQTLSYRCSMSANNTLWNSSSSRSKIVSQVVVQSDLWSLDNVVFEQFIESKNF